jgi:hypothetical protein
VGLARNKQKRGRMKIGGDRLMSGDRFWGIERIRGTSALVASIEDRDGTTYFIDPNGNVIT